MILDILHQSSLKICQQWAWWWEASNKEDELVRAILTVLVVILFICWCTWMFVQPGKGIDPLPPGPRGLPIVGYLPFLGTNLHHSFAELADRYGPIYKLRLGSKLCVVLSSPSLFKEVVRDHDTTFANRDPPAAALVLTYGGSDIAWSPYGPVWRALRKVFVREMMSNASLEACYQLRRDAARKIIREVHTRIGTPVDLGEMTFSMALNVVRSMLWGGTLEGDNSTSAEAEFREVVSRLTYLLGQPNISDFFPVLARFDLQGVEREMKGVLAWLESILDPIIDKYMKMDIHEAAGDSIKKGRMDFLYILLELKKKEDAANPITLRQIKALLFDIIVGATDTTAATTEWLMAEMMHNPEIMKKVQEELAKIVGMNIVEDSHLPKLQYLDAVVKETLRLHPVVPLSLPKRPSEVSIVGGYTIPKNAKVFLNVWAIHRDPQAWDDAAEFKPERFLNDPNRWDYSGNNFQYLPFGSGRRVCAGLNLARSVVMHAAASFLHSFNWQLPNGEELDLSENFGIVMKKKAPLIIIPTQRWPSRDLYA